MLVYFDDPDQEAVRLAGMPERVLISDLLAGRAPANSEIELARLKRLRKQTRGMTSNGVENVLMF